MQLPFFFEEDLPSNNFLMSEESSRHIAQVLRMKEDEQIRITNGNGQLLTASLVKLNKKNAEVKILSEELLPQSKPKIIVAVSLIKNASRFEWFLEKATEIGVNEIIPLISERTEKQHYRHNRMRKVIISAMLQSQQVWMPVFKEPILFKELVKNFACQNKLIAHCIDENDRKFLSLKEKITGDQLILIGPEGDFTKSEIDTALQNNFSPVSLGQTRLRTETAALVAAVLLSNRRV
jgi:16S rRNA (uracil1498-N3)-methyltransferase